MAKFLQDQVNDEAKENVDQFVKKTESEMHFKSDFFGDALSFDWVDEIENACPFIDNVVRRPKLILIQEENVVPVEKSKKITVASIKDLARHTNYISKVDKKTQEVQPSKILDIRNEETFNIYENRFLYTLINDMNRFLMKKEDLLNDLEINNDKTLTYKASTETKKEKIKIEVNLTSEENPDESNTDSLKKQIEVIKGRVKRIREYITSWERSDMVKALDEAHVAFINPPVKPTNIILKNPNFQVAVKLWEYLRNYDYVDRDNSEENLNNKGNNAIKGFLDHSFLLDYLVLDSISTSKKQQKQNITAYAIIILTQEIHRVLTLLLNNGIKITDEELLSLIAKEIKNDKNNRLVGIDDVKKKFKSAMDEYIERTQDYL